MINKNKEVSFEVSSCYKDLSNEQMAKLFFFFLLFSLNFSCKPLVANQNQDFCLIDFRKVFQESI